MSKIYTIFLISSFSISSVSNAAPNGQSDIIVIEDKAGVIQEKRVKSIQSEIKFTPKNMVPYDIITITNDGADGLSQHTDNESLSIPTWTFFSW
ncbi:MAG TPA: DUF2782 domain-containing protein [Thiotrichaceae bacterium]|nr:DUF2782 domain-containing protein [Thiotrichaceae bacterium]